MSLIFTVLAILAFLIVAIIGEDMTDPNEALRWTAAGLAFFAAAHVAWPANWGPGPRS